MLSWHKLLLRTRSGSVVLLQLEFVLFCQGAEGHAELVLPFAGAGKAGSDPHWVSSSKRADPDFHGRPGSQHSGEMSLPLTMAIENWA